MLIVSAVTLAIAGGVATPTSAAPVAFSEYSVRSGGGPERITAQPGGDVWFTLPTDDAVGRVSESGRTKVYPLPSPYQEPRDIVAAPDGTVWFTETGSHTGAEGIGKITASGDITSFSVPENTGPFSITVGPDGNLWFTTLRSRGQIGRMTPSGTVTIFPAQMMNSPVSIVSGPDGNLWIAESGIVWGGRGAVGRMTPAGTLTEYPLPTPPGYSSGAQEITVGPDGNLWFTWTEQQGGEAGPYAASIGRINTSGEITKFPISPTGGWPPGGITAGPDGNLWFGESTRNRIGSTSVTGTLSHYRVPTPHSLPRDVVAGTDGDLWFTEGLANAIGRLVLNPPRCLGRPATQLGTSRRETLIGTSRADVLVGAGGIDKLKSKGGADRICSGGADDKLSGGANADTLNGGAGDDSLRGGPGNDRCVGGPGNDRVRSC